VHRLRRHRITIVRSGSARIEGDGNVDNLSALPNIGVTLASELEKAGIASYDELVDVGSVEATLRVARREAEPCYNKLYALEGAIRGVRWHAIPKEERAGLKEQYDRARSA